MSNRADFPAAVRRIIAERAGYQCSVLNCGRLTVGPGSRSTQVMNVGMAAHIYAASPGGPRGTGGLSTSERSAPENGMWCCYFHGKAIDSDDGAIFSAAQLKAWKRLHEARKAAEIVGQPQDRFGLVESIAVNSAPASLAGRRFELGMRNIITGPNGSGKSILARLIASVAYPDHVAELSRNRDVDIEVRWFDPLTHDVATRGRSGDVTHVLDGRPVPYVARPYKTVLLSELGAGCVDSLVSLAQAFDLSLSAMKATLNMVVESSEIVKEVHVSGAQIDWTLDLDGRIIRTAIERGFSRSHESILLFEVAGAHARHHARVEPTFLLLDESLGFLHPRAQIVALERLQKVAEHAQVAVITHSPQVVAELSRDWTMTELDDYRTSDSWKPWCPLDFEIETTRIDPENNL